MPKFTPGKWRVGNPLNREITVTHRGKVLAFLPAPRREDERQAYTNAQLIAAAPGMYHGHENIRSHAEKAISCLGAQDYVGLGIILAEIMLESGAILAKAEGKEPENE